MGWRMAELELNFLVAVIITDRSELMQIVYADQQGGPVRQQTSPTHRQRRVQLNFPYNVL
jgi:hypothetical protein